jgi:CBS domain-containing protein
MFVRDILAEKGTEVVTVLRETNVREFVKILVEHRIGAVPVSDGKGGVAGVMSERDVIYTLAEKGADCLDGQVGDLMSTDVAACEPGTTIDSIMGLMTRRRIRHLPVLEDGQLVGIVSIGDIVKWRIAQAEREASELRNYITA